MREPGVYIGDSQCVIEAKILTRILIPSIGPQGVQKANKQTEIFWIGLRAP